MNRSTMVPVVLGMVLASAPAMAEETQRIGVLGGDFSDLSLVVERGESCAEFLQYLQSQAEKYAVISVASVQGPPGVIYTLQNPKGEIAILKCGTACGHEGGEGH